MKLINFSVVLQQRFQAILLNWLRYNIGRKDNNEGKNRGFMENNFGWLRDFVFVSFFIFCLLCTCAYSGRVGPPSFESTMPTNRFACNSSLPLINAPNRYHQFISVQECESALPHAHDHTKHFTWTGRVEPFQWIVICVRVHTPNSFKSITI